MSSNGAGPVLIVDDDDGIREFVEIALRDEGYEVLNARDGQSALAILGERRPKVILLDMRMPGMNGWEFAEAYRHSPLPRVPIIVVTAGRDAATKAREIGADAHLAKPFDLQELLDLVAQFTRA